MKEHVLLLEAIHALKIDVPILRYDVNDNIITLYLYGGQVKTFSAAGIPAAADAAALLPPARKSKKMMKPSKKP